MVSCFLSLLLFFFLKPVCRIRITMMRIRILLFNLMRIRIPDPNFHSDADLDPTTHFIPDLDTPTLRIGSGSTTLSQKLFFLPTQHLSTKKMNRYRAGTYDPLLVITRMVKILTCCRGSRIPGWRAAGGSPQSPPSPDTPPAAGWPHTHTNSWRKYPVLRIPIRMFLGLPDPDPEPSIIEQNSKKTLIPTVLWLLCDFLSSKMM